MAALCHVVVFPYPLPGHIIPISSFSQALASSKLADMRVTIVHTEANLHKLQQQKKNGISPSNLHMVAISDGLPLHFDRNADYFSFFITIQQMGPALQRVLQELNAACPISCLVSDPNFPWVVDVANHLSIPLFLFVTDSAATFAVSLHAQRLLSDGFLGKGSPKHPGMLMDFIPGIPALPVKTLPFPPAEVSDLDFFFHLRLTMFDRIHEAAGVLLNSFYELESGAIDGATGHLAMPVLPVGPCVPEVMLRDDYYNKDTGDDVLRWLDWHAPGSVMYVCFGSLAMLSSGEGVGEIWEGLRASGQPFLWATRSVLAKDLWRGNGKVHEAGLVVEWVPQQQVLCHPAIGGFMTHCGWNSVLEAVSAGVPMLCCPFFLDQPLNGILVAEVWRVGVNAGEFMEPGCLQKLIRLILLEDEGKFLKQRAKQLREAAKASIQCFPPGSSTCNLITFINLLRKEEGSCLQS